MQKTLCFDTLIEKKSLHIYKLGTRQHHTIQLNPLDLIKPIMPTAARDLTSDRTMTRRRVVLESVLSKMVVLQS
jgi:hypothetical protein